MPNGFEHSIDFNNYNPKSVYNFANESSRISDLDNPTFYESLQNHFDEVFIKDKHFLLSQNLCNALTLKSLDKLASLHPKIKEDKNSIGSYFQK
jgi:hypothetical protein